MPQAASKQSDREVQALDPDEIIAAQWRLSGGCPVRRGQVGKCGGRILYRCGYRSGKRNKLTALARCEEHAAAYAAKHGLELPAHLGATFGPIVEVDFFHPDGRLGGGLAYTAEVDRFRSSRTTADDLEENAHLLRDGEPLELWVHLLREWRACRFRWSGMGAPVLEGK